MKLIYLIVAALLPLSVNAQDEPIGAEVKTMATGSERKLGLQHTSSLGYVITGGNSNAETVNFSQETQYVWAMDRVSWTGNYLSSKQKDTQTDIESVTAENWATTLRYEHIFSGSLGGYTQTGLAADRFQGVRERKTFGLGARYDMMKTSSFTWFDELGYEYARELFVDNGSVPAYQTLHPEYHFARLYTQADYQANKGLKMGIMAELLYPFADQRAAAPGEDKKVDYRINFSPYLISVLSDMFSLKVSYDGRYRNVPVVAGNEYLDFTFSTTLMATY